MNLLALLMATALIGSPDATLKEASPTHPSERPTEFTYAKARLGTFEVNAKTEVQWRENAPYPSNITCYASNSDVSLLVGQSAQVEWLRFAFNGSPAKKGEGSQPALLGDGLWLFVDGRRYELRNEATRPAAFSNYPYAAPAAKDDIVLPIWHGNQMVRASPNEPFVHINLIVGDVVRAKSLAWAFKSRNWEQVDRREPENALPVGWQTHRYAIDNRNLKEAFDWCARAISSNDARRIPDFGRR